LPTEHDGKLVYAALEDCPMDKELAPFCIALDGPFSSVVT
jgi:hypothetical protein